MTTDLVVTTCERLDLLKRTLTHIWERTTTPYRLHVIDDASRVDGNAAYLRDLLQAGLIHNLVLRERRLGIPAGLRTALSITTSDPVVITDDDVLCPQLDPDWLARGLAEMEAHPRLGILGLNNPQNNAGDAPGTRRNRRYARATISDGRVTLCRNVGGTFAFIRRAVLRDFIPHDSTAYVFKTMCMSVRRPGCNQGLVGYLTHVYCQHIGVRSVRMRRAIRACFHNILPIDPITLIPEELYRG